MKKQEGYVPGALGMPLALENLHFSVSSSSSGEHGFPGSTEVKHRVWH